MDFELSTRSAEILDRLRAFMREHVIPRNAEYHACVERSEHPLPFIDELKDKAKQAGLFNLFMPELPEHYPGTRLSNLDYAPLAEEMGRTFWSSEVFNCSAPDTGNMELLHLFASPMQRERFLEPLLHGKQRSMFAMTEPDVASSDPTNLRTTILRDGDDYVINGRKWFTSGANDPRARFAIVMGVTALEGEPHKRHGMVIVPRDTKGMRIVRNIPVMHHVSLEGHCEVIFDDARVPADHLLGQEGEGFAMAQARLGPGRIHHCMRSIGQCEVALELMAERMATRIAFGKPLGAHGSQMEHLARARIQIEQARMLVMKAAWLMDREGPKAARKHVSMAKAVVPQIQTDIAARAIQLFGAKGLTSDTDLAFIHTWGMALHIVDGPDEVHLQTIAKAELKEQAARRAGR